MACMSLVKFTPRSSTTTGWPATGSAGVIEKPVMFGVADFNVHENRFETAISSWSSFTTAREFVPQTKVLSTSE